MTVLASITAAASVGLSVALFPWTSERPERVAPVVETVTVAPAAYAYRLPGDFRRDGVAVDAPVVERELDRPLVIMAKQVSAAAYDLCVEDGVCRARDAAAPSGSDVPAVGMSWVDATSYARWLSDRTGEVWRLPTDEEWIFAAGSRAVDEALPEDAGDDFSDRWLARYEQEARRERLANGTPRPIGTFGANENGLVDVAGNVWEWTDTCFTRQSIDAEGNLLDDGVVNCGVRVVEGAHRTYMTDFIRDAKSGGCGVGTPPANLGFRLVRETGVDRLVAR